MRFRLVTLILYAIAMSVALLPGQFAIGKTASLPECDQGDCDRIKSNDPTARVIRLDLRGTRGGVVFRHRHHEAYLNPSGDLPHQAQKGAACIGCHHKRTEFSGVPILVKCITCHGGDGDPKNPRNKDGDEARSERAFHDLCIGCHRAINEKGQAKCEKAPVACSECHGPKQ